MRVIQPGIQPRADRKPRVLIAPVHRRFGVSFALDQSSHLTLRLRMNRVELTVREASAAIGDHDPTAARTMLVHPQSRRAFVGRAGERSYDF